MNPTGNVPTPEQKEARKKQAIAKLNETPERIKAGFQQIRLLVLVTSNLFFEDVELMLRMKFKLEEMREAFLGCAEQCNSLLKEIENGTTTKRAAAANKSPSGNHEPEPPKAA